MGISPTIEITFLLAVVFLYMVPRIIKSRWYFLRAHFPVKKNDLIGANFCWGRANIGGIFCRYAIFSAIEKEGIYLKQAIPFSIYLPPIFIDWNEVESLTIFEDVEGKMKSRKGVIKTINPFKFVGIKLAKINDLPILIKWKHSYEDKIPDHMLKDLDL